MNALKRCVVVVGLAALLCGTQVSAASATTLNLRASERARLAAFLTAFTRSGVKDFSATKGATDAQLIEFATRELYLVDRYTNLPNGRLAIDAEQADELSFRYFGRRPKDRNAHLTITYVDGVYACGPYDVAAPRAKLLKATRAKNGNWIVTYNKFGWDGASPTDVNLAQCVATLRVSKSAEPTYTLQALTTTKWRIPDERGVFFTDAERNLKAWGFRYHSIGVYRGDGAKTSDGTVYRQSPKAGTLAPKKTRVTIWWGYERS